MCVGISSKSARFDPFEIRSGPPSPNWASGKKFFVGGIEEGGGREKESREKEARELGDRNEQDRSVSTLWEKGMAETEMDDDVS